MEYILSADQLNTAASHEAAGLQLPEHLLERISELTSFRATPAGEYVLYWAHHALRAHQNAGLHPVPCPACSNGPPW